MKENQHNDNLERFFKANLQNYSPVPSSDFWDRMGPVIPPKPSFWQRWRPSAGQWSGLLLALLVVVSVLWLWHQERVNVERLTKTVKQQQRQIEELDQQKTLQEKAPAEQNLLKTEPKPTEKSSPSLPSIASAPAFQERKIIFNTPTLPIYRKANSSFDTGEKSDSQNDYLASQNIDNQIDKSSLGGNSSVSPAIGQAAAESTNATESDATSNEPSDIALLSQRNAFVSSKTKQTLPYMKRLAIANERIYPRFSVEAGGTVFRLPLGRLFQQDTFLTGRTELSYDAGLSLNCELNNRMSLQVGYQFTNLRARRLALRYNTFPVSVQRRWAWGYRKYLEGKIGVSLNSLVSGRTDSDGISVRGLKTTWVGLHGGIAANWLLTDKLSIVVGPSAGFSLTPMTTGRRSWEVGMSAGVRYQL